MAESGERPIVRTTPDEDWLNAAGTSGRDWDFNSGQGMGRGCPNVSRSVVEMYTGVRGSRRYPFTNVPLVEPKSSRMYFPPSKLKRQCFWETTSFTTMRSQSGALPIVHEALGESDISGRGKKMRNAITKY